MDFADNNLIKVKIIPDNKEIYSSDLTIELYENTPVLNLRKVPLYTQYGRIVKCSFDIVFSSFVIIGILSWVTPLLFIIVKFDSPGPLYFTQKRHGLKRKIFWCYKFRSMHSSCIANSEMSTINDNQITRLGAILRKTIVDELPLFFNVFFGTMSVEGPRPHMKLHTYD